MKKKILTIIIFFLIILFIILCIEGYIHTERIQEYFNNFSSNAHLFSYDTNPKYLDNDISFKKIYVEDPYDKISELGSGRVGGSSVDRFVEIQEQSEALDKLSQVNKSKKENSIKISILRNQQTTLKSEITTLKSEILLLEQSTVPKDTKSLSEKKKSLIQKENNLKDIEL